MKSFARMLRVVVHEVRRASVVHVEQPGVVGAVGLMVGRTLRRPLVVDVVGDSYESVHPSVVPGFKGRVAHVVLPALQRWACAAAVCVNYVPSKQLIRRYPPAPGAETFTSSTATPLGPARPRPYPGDAVSVVTVASLEQPYKGVAELIEAVARCTATGKNVHLTVVGAGRLRADLERQARSVAPGCVTFAGHLYGSDLYQELGKHDVFALASWTEGMPRALVEAMADGMPAVATGVGGVPDILEDTRIAPVRDSAGFAEVLLRLLADEPGWRVTTEHNLRVSEDVIRDGLDGGERFTAAVVSLVHAQRRAR